MSNFPGQLLCTVGRLHGENCAIDLSQDGVITVNNVHYLTSRATVRVIRELDLYSKPELVRKFNVFTFPNADPWILGHYVLTDEQEAARRETQRKFQEQFDSITVENYLNGTIKKL